MFITIPLVVAIMFTFPKRGEKPRLRPDNSTIRGKVTSYQQSDHNRCSYQFAVLGQQYNGRDSAPNVGMAIGENVLVYYDRENPAFNALEDFSQQAGQDQGFAVMCLCLIGIFAGIFLFSKAHHSGTLGSGH
jgi:hypothetical protein